MNSQSYRKSEPEYFKTLTKLDFIFAQMLDGNSRKFYNMFEDKQVDDNILLNMSCEKLEICLKY